MQRIITIFAIVAILCGCSQKNGKIVILHTNDTHSRNESEKNNSGGALNRALLIEQMRDSAGRENTLLFDCGDFSQGSLYYNVYKGAFEIDIMNAMEYDAGTIGNHEFDYGLENLAQLLRRARFPIVCANYNFSGTPCEGLAKPYVTLERGGARIGVFGLSPDPDGLVLKEHYEGVEFISPIEAANHCVKELKKAGCDIIICLSHLGWQIDNEYNDEKLATQTSGIDIILGGHSHDYFEEPLTYTNAEGKGVVMQQTGKNGRHIGKLSIEFIK